MSLLFESVLIGKMSCVLSFAAWLSHEAIQIANAVKNEDIFFEQPCYDYSETMRVRKIYTLHSCFNFFTLFEICWYM